MGRDKILKERRVHLHVDLAVNGTNAGVAGGAHQ